MKKSLLLLAFAVVATVGNVKAQTLGLLERFLAFECNWRTSERCEKQSWTCAGRICKFRNH